MRYVLTALFFLTLLSGQPAAAQIQARRAHDPGPGGGAVPPSRGSTNFDATYYHLDLALHFDTQTISGRVRADGTVTGKALTELVFDLLSSETPSGIEVDSVRMTAGARVPFTHLNDVVRIELPRTYAVGERVSVEIFYRGKPEDPEAFRFGRISSTGMLYAWSLSEPYGARSWWPNKDHPSDKADSVRVTVTVPQGMRVGSNGLLRSETPGAGTVTYDWVSHYPISTYLVSLAAAPYETFEQRYVRPDSLAGRYGALDMPVLHYQYPGSGMYPVQGPFNGWAHVTRALAVLEYWFGPYPFAKEKYGHAQFTWGGGMEHQTMTSLSGNSIDLVVHELAHAWYGDAVTTRTWPHLWLNEGFATYGEVLFRESAGPSYAPTARAAIEENVAFARRASGTLVVADTASSDNLFDSRRVYSKGGMVLHMLRGVIGTEKFRNVLQQYAADPALRYGTATTADFQRVAEQVSGTDLDFFFKQWVTEGTGYPRYEVKWNARQAESGYEVIVHVAQRQTAPASNVDVFTMPIQLAITTESGVKRFTAWNDQREQDYVFDVPDKPTEVVFDPDLYLLRDDVVTSLRTETLPFPDSEAALTDIFPNPAIGTVHVEVVLTRANTVVLELFDTLGRRVQTLADGPETAGTHRYLLDVSHLPAGRYFLHLAAGGVKNVRAITVVH